MITSDLANMDNPLSHVSGDFAYLRGEYSRLLSTEFPSKIFKLLVVK